MSENVLADSQANNDATPDVSSTSTSMRCASRAHASITCTLERGALIATRHAGEVKLFRRPLAAGLTPPDGPAPLHAIYKVANRPAAIKTLFSELSYYEDPLKTLQGSAVPRCLGFLAGRDQVSGRRVACLVLEDCGRPIEGSFSEQTHETKQKIVDAVVRLHDAGIVHGNLDEENVLEDAHGRISIIDFDMDCVTTGHRCRRPRDPVVGELACYPQSFYCDEIWSLCERLGMWKPNQIEYYGTYYHLKIAFNVFKLASYALEPDADEHWCTEEDAIREAFRVNIEYAREFGNEFHDTELIARHEVLLRDREEWEASVEAKQAEAISSCPRTG